MEKDVFINLIDKIKEKFPEKTNELASSLFIVNKSLDNIVLSIIEEMKNQITERNFDIYDLSQPALELELIQDEIKDLMYYINPNFKEAETEANRSDSVISLENTEEKRNKNYADYEVDNTIAYSVEVPFTHKRPFGYELLDKTLKESKTWKDLFVSICEDLLNIDEDKFLSFENNENMKGRSGKYFSINNDELKEPLSICNKIYAESIKSGESIRMLLIKMLHEYNIDINDLKIYLKADYTDLNS